MHGIVPDINSLENTIKQKKEDTGVSDPNASSNESATSKLESGVDWALVDLENPDGVVSEFLTTTAGILSAGLPKDATQENALKISKPVTAVNSQTNKSVYYSEDVQSSIYKSTVAVPKVGVSKKQSHEKDGTATTTEVHEGAKPYSIFNKYTLINYRGSQVFGDPEGYNSASGKHHKINPEELIDPSASKIIEVTGTPTTFGDATGPGKGINKGYRYDYSDFALVKYYGKISNNYMITLRRFAFPVGDDIITPKIMGVEDGKGKLVDNSHPDIARAITYLGDTTGNDIKEIVKFSHGYNWKEATANVQTINSPSRAAASGKFGAIVNGSNFLSAAANASAGRGAVESNRREQNAGFDQFSNTYPNHVFGPLNIINQTLVREKGLTFDQEFTLKFEYELKSIQGINPKIMMLDQLANILALTSNTAPFWGGAVRYIGGGRGVARPLGTLSKLQSGDYAGFLGSVVSDMGKMFGGLGEDIMNLAKGKDSKLLNNLLGGGLMRMFNTPQGGQAANALLTGDPTGQWHVTIGNPLNPIMVVGNLTCQSTDIVFEGGLGVQDFPERMVVTIKLKPGRPRDKAEIESMFNAGRGRFYLTPEDGVDVNKTSDVSAYGNKDREGFKMYNNKMRKLANG